MILVWPKVQGGALETCGSVYVGDVELNKVGSVRSLPTTIAMLLLDG